MNTQPDELQAEITRLRATIAELREEREWRPIATAPKDGSEILGWREDCGMLLIRWTSPAEFLSQFELDAIPSVDPCEEDWFCADFVNGSRLEGDESPTLWLPLPQPPEAARQPSSGREG